MLRNAAVALVLFSSLSLTSCKSPDGASALRDDPSIVDVEREWAEGLKTDVTQARDKNEDLKEGLLDLAEAATVAERRATRRVLMDKLKISTSELKAVLLRMQDKMQNPTVAADVQEVAQVPGSEFRTQLDAVDDLVKDGGKVDELKETINDYAVELAGAGPERVALRNKAKTEIAAVTTALNALTEVLESWILAATGTGGGGGGNGGGNGGDEVPPADVFADQVTGLWWRDLGAWPGNAELPTRCSILGSDWNLAKSPQLLNARARLMNSQINNVFSIGASVEIYVGDTVSSPYAYVSMSGGSVSGNGTNPRRVLCVRQSASIGLVWKDLQSGLHWKDLGDWSGDPELMGRCGTLGSGWQLTSVAEYVNGYSRFQGISVTASTEVYVRDQVSNPYGYSTSSGSLSGNGSNPRRVLCNKQTTEFGPSWTDPVTNSRWYRLGTFAGDAQLKDRCAVLGQGWKLPTSSVLINAAPRLVNSSQNTVFSLSNGTEVYVSDALSNPYAYVSVGSSSVTGGGGNRRLVLCVR